MKIFSAWYYLLILYTLCLHVQTANAQAIPSNEILVGGKTRNETLVRNANTSWNCNPVFSYDTPDPGEGGIATNGKTIWVIGLSGTGIYKTDCTTGAVVQILPFPSITGTYYGGDIDYYNGFLWYVNEQMGTLFQLDTINGSVINQFLLPNNSVNVNDPNNWGIACEDNFFWNAEYAVNGLSSFQSLIHKISYSGAHLDSFLVNYEILPLRLINNELWGISFNTPWMYRFDKTTGAVLDSVDRCVSTPYGLDANAYGIWLSGGSSFNNNSIHNLGNLNTSLNEPGHVNYQVTAYPQPSQSDFVYIQISGLRHEIVQVQLCDLRSRATRKMSLKFDTDTAVLDLQGCAAGVYDLNLFFDEGIFHTKLIKL